MTRIRRPGDDRSEPLTAYLKWPTAILRGGVLLSRLTGSRACVGLCRLATRAALGRGLPSFRGTLEGPGDERRHASGDEGVHDADTNMRCRPPNRRPGTSLVVSHERTLRLGELNWSSQHREHGVDFESAGDDIEILKRMDSMDDYGDAKPSFRRRAGRNREHGFGGPFHRAGSHVFHQVIFNPRP